MNFFLLTRAWAQSCLKPLSNEQNPCSNQDRSEQWLSRRVLDLRSRVPDSSCTGGTVLVLEKNTLFIQPMYCSNKLLTGMKRLNTHKSKKEHGLLLEIALTDP